ncbi:MAG TPA: PEP/pyruvate-binding domain-containing protein, partial [Myxococcota bacterium]|nr:PEP/pyruvate-binding domain-containing protein [Myxococcota bacterium]
MPTLVRAFETLSIDDIPLVGGKNASLGEMIRELGARGVKVPGGFATTADAWRLFIAHNQLGPVIHDALDGLDLRDVPDLQRRGLRLREAILAAELPPELAQEVAAAYDALGDQIDVAVRSSATAEDLADASFAGQQETWLNVRGRAALLDHVRRCYASLFTDRAITYRTERGFAHDAVALSVGVQRMVRSDRAGAGVMFTLDTETGFPDLVVITAAWGLGENVVQGAVVPDEYGVFKPTLAHGYRPIVRKTLGSKELRMVYDAGGGRLTRNEPTTPEERQRFVLTDDEILTLARQAVIIEQHYSARHQRPVPMDIEWAKDGLTGELFIVQARPETVQSRRARVLETFTLDGVGPVVARGRAVGDRVATGRARIIHDTSELGANAIIEVITGYNIDTSAPANVRVTATHADPAFDIENPQNGHDIAVVMLDRDIGITPIAFNRTALTRAMIGQPVRLVGYGLSDGVRQTGAGLKRQVTSQLNNFDNMLLSLGDGSHNTCSGD